MNNDTIDSLKDLDDFDTADLDAPSERPDRSSPDPVKQGQYKERCGKCRGSGKFVSYSGRVVGECFKCDGKGWRYFATSPEQRRKSREQGRARRERQQAEKRQAKAQEFSEWLDAHPDVKQWLNDNGPHNDFAASLIQGGAKYGSLTEGQVAAVRKAMQREAAKAERKADAEITLDGLRKAFDTAKSNGLRKPALRIGQLKVTMAPDTGKNPGCLYFKRNGEYCGKADQQGRFYGVRNLPQEILDEIKAISADVMAKAVEHGRLTGNCACCGRELTRRDSIEAGIGPICAENFGL